MPEYPTHTPEALYAEHKLPYALWQRFEWFVQRDLDFLIHSESWENDTLTVYGIESAENFREQCRQAGIVPEDALLDCLMKAAAEEQCPPPPIFSLQITEGGCCEEDTCRQWNMLPEDLFWKFRHYAMPIGVIREQRISDFTDDTLIVTIDCDDYAVLSIGRYKNGCSDDEWIKAFDQRVEDDLLEALCRAVSDLGYPDPGIKHIRFYDDGNTWIFEGSY